MIRIVKKAFYSVLAFCIILIGLGIFLISTTPGLYTAIKVGKSLIPGKLWIRDLNGSLAKQFTIGELEYRFEDITIHIKNLSVSWDFNTLLQHKIHIHSLSATQFSFNTEHKTPLYITLKLPFKLQIDRAFADKVHIQIKDFVQQIETLQGRLSLNEQALIINALTFNLAKQSFAAQFNVASDYPYPMHGKLQMNPLGKVLHGKLLLDGDYKLLQWIGEVHGLIELNMQGSLKEFQELTQSFKWKQIAWSINANNKLKSPEGSLKLQGILPNFRLDIDSSLALSEKQWLLKAAIQGSLPWAWHIAAQLNPAPNTKKEGLMSQLTLKGEMSDSNKGSWDLQLSPGTYHLAEDALISSLAFQGGRLVSTHSPQGVTGKGALAIDEAKKITFDFSLPGFDLAKKIDSKQPIKANVSLEINSLDFLSKLSYEITHPMGTLTATLKATGPLNNLLLESALSLSRASLSIPMLGLNIDNMEFSILGKNKQWQGNGFMQAAGHRIEIQGQGPLSPPLNATMTLQGSDFPVVNTKEYQLNISPQLELKISPSLVNITGLIKVPYARVIPQTFTNSTTLSEDVVFIQHHHQSSPQKTSMDLRIEMGQDVELSFKGLHASLIGTVTLNQQPQGIMRANGELSVKKGEYKAYGQDLNIDQGQLLFTGGPWDTPGINLRASKNINNENNAFASSDQLFDFNTNNLQIPTIGTNVRVGVEVSGRLNNPKIQLFSVPAILSQADILSMLVLGRPASQANKAGGQLLLAAISSMNGKNGAQLIEQLKQSLGFDLNVKTTTSFNQQTKQLSDSTSVVVGKSLSKRIYLSYNVGLAQADPNVFTLKYLLNKFLSIQVSTSESGHGIDVFYTRSKEKKL